MRVNMYILHKTRICNYWKLETAVLALPAWLSKSHPLSRSAPDSISLFHSIHSFIHSFISRQNIHELYTNTMHVFTCILYLYENSIQYARTILLCISLAHPSSNYDRSDTEGTNGGGRRTHMCLCRMSESIHIKINIKYTLTTMYHTLSSSSLAHSA